MYKKLLRYQLCALLIAVVAGRQDTPKKQASFFRGGSSPLQRKAQPSYFSPRSPPKKTWSGSKSTTTNSPIRDMDDLSTKEVIASFLTRDSRSTFIARVYAILAGQLLVTAAVCVLFGVNPFLSSLPSQINSGQYQGALATIPLLGVLVSTIAWFRVCMSPEARQRSPNKWWWLSLFTLGESVSVGFLTSFFKFQSVVISMGATAVATITVSALTILQKNPKYDLSQWGNTLSSWAMILLVYLIIGWFQQSGWLPAGFMPYSNLAYSFLASCLFSAFLAHHTKLIVAGKHAKYRMNEKDYVLGAMALYSDIINIFLNVLQILGQEKD